MRKSNGWQIPYAKRFIYMMVMMLYTLILVVGCPLILDDTALIVIRFALYGNLAFLSVFELNLWASIVIVTFASAGTTIILVSGVYLLYLYSFHFFVLDLMHMTTVEYARMKRNQESTSLSTDQTTTTWFSPICKRNKVYPEAGIHQIVK
ncbi:hypothetical protein MIR68_005965 [Amoeboaphelidium protococcarum]|nr:hypothetical protein MIR68_005965 [Amoeboaphelidium protococcarum]